MNPELEQHLKMMRDWLDEMDEVYALREAATHLLDALEKINQNYEGAETVLSERSGRVRGMNYAMVQAPMTSALEEVVDAPKHCQKKLYGGRAYSATPEPDEYCDNWAVPGEDYCEEHL